MKEELALSNEKHGIVGLTGHVGIAHAHGANNYQQDDGGGFCAAGTIVSRALGVDTRVREVSCTTEKIEVKLMGGGSASTMPRRRVTPQEAAMMKRAEGKDALFSQGIAADIFGRVYGQGVAETGACFQAALALSVLDSFKKADPDKVFVVPESEENAGAILGTVLGYDGIPVSVVMPVNFTGGGLGPDEDYEGNFMHGMKGEMMEKIGYPLPTIVAESKVYSFLSETIDENKFLIRYSEDKGDPSVAKALEESCKELSVPYFVRNDLLNYDSESFQELSSKFAAKLEKLAAEIREAEKASVKVRLVGELAKLVSEDAAGFTYMSKSVFAESSSPGLHPKTSAVLSMIVGKNYIKDSVIPVMTESDRDDYVRVILSSLKKIAQRT
ncbi:MAG TPA: hypothetical protein DCM41_02980 [Synergistaceae bacterium]|nr:hypothetical protein [Synergistaceae bacterium]